MQSRRDFLAASIAIALWARRASAADPVLGLISCGGLKTLDLIVPLERRCKVPVVSSTPHALMASVRLVGRSGRPRGFGRVLARA